jgi:hypothetical protein
MPSEYSMDELPRPNDGGVHLVNAEGRSFASLSFTGLSGTRKTERLKKRLMRLVSETGLEASGPAMLAVYDNPNTTLPFLRRNEILIPIHD